jgi:hypothetical protein
MMSADKMPENNNLCRMIGLPAYNMVCPCDIYNGKKRKKFAGKAQYFYDVFVKNRHLKPDFRRVVHYNK